MKKFLQSVRAQEGFTLIELMVVVAIIGLLSGVAIPNFKKYQAKAKITEAKLQLSAAYVAEASFFADYNMYASCLNYMGFNPNPEAANRYFAIGIVVGNNINADAHAGAVKSGLDAAGCPAAYALSAAVVGAASLSPNNFFPAAKGIGGSIANTDSFLSGSALGTQEDKANMTFKIGTAGVIEGSYVADTDSAALTIDHDKVLRTVRQGY